MPGGRPTVEDDKATFIEALTSAGSSAGNVALRRTLNWQEDRYWRTHTDLLNDGRIGRGRGKGGSVFLTLRSSESALKDQEILPGDLPEIEMLIPTTIIPLEGSLYEPARKIVEDHWSRERGFDSAIVEITANKHLRNGGRWTCPDVTLVASKSYPYLPGRTFEIITFELKKTDSIDVRGVFEALSHRRFSTMSYVLFLTGTANFDWTTVVSSRIREVAREHGVGIISAEKIDDYTTWEEIVEARRNLYDPGEANSFVGSTLSDETKSKIIQWQK